MSSQLEIYIGGEKTTHAELPTVDIPPDATTYSYGEPVEIKLRNSGTTRLHNITLTPGGEGRSNVALSVSRETEGAPAAKLQLPGSIGPDEEQLAYAFGCYRADEAEDAQDFELVVTAVSVG